VAAKRSSGIGSRVTWSPWSTSRTRVTPQRRRTSAGIEICPLEVIFMVGMAFIISMRCDMIER
jgi:hypothetical protein